MSIISNIKSSFLTRIGSFFLLFFSSVLLSRLLGPEGRGLFAIVSANTEIFSIILGFNLSQTLIYFIAKDVENFSKILSIILSLIFFSSTIFLIILYASYNIDILNFIVPKPYNQNSLYFLLSFLLFTTGLLNSFIDSTWQGLKKFTILNYFLLVNGFLTLITYWYLLNYTKISIFFSFENVFYSFIFLNILLVSIKFYFFIDGNKFKFKLSINEINILIPLLKYGITSWSANFINFLGKRLSIWIIFYFSDMSNVGYFSLVSNLIDILVLMIYSTNTVISPYITDAGIDERLMIFSRFMRFISTIMLFTILVVILLGPYVIITLYGKPFITCINPLKILVIGSLFLVLHNTIALFNAAIGEQTNNLIANIAGLASVVVFSIILIPSWGINGACIATSISYFTRYIVSYLKFRKKYCFNIKSLFFLNKGDLVFLQNSISKHL